MYNYKEAVKEDVAEYLNGEINLSEWTPESLEEYLNETLWLEDSVTGNASGSYTFNAWEAEENLCHNLGLLADALDEFGESGDYLLREGAEAADVTIRCYLLAEAIAETISEIMEGR